MKFIKSLYFSSELFLYLWGIIFLFAAGFFAGMFLFLAKILIAIFLLLLCVDLYILYRTKNGFIAVRDTPNRLSNGDENVIKINLTNNYSFNINASIIDELPFQFQMRDVEFKTSLSKSENKSITYNLKPFERGEYNFGSTNVFVSSPLNLVVKRYKFLGSALVPVYPSYIQMRKYELLAISNRLTEAGIKKIRNFGHSTEFEQIKEYVKGDDYRTVNWKATARKSELMVNHFVEEKSQQVFCVINTGRVMKMPFEGMSLLDYAINASLVLSKIVIQKEDKAGLITFSNKINTILPADNRPVQMNKILELLYKQTVEYPETDYEVLYSTLLSKINHRSLIVLYTNFETLESLNRQIGILRKLALSHLVVVIIFENTALKSLLVEETKNAKEIYIKTIAEKFAFEKRQIIKELNRYKIHAVLTPPDKLSVNIINKYLEIKARNLI